MTRSNKQFNERPDEETRHLRSSEEKLRAVFNAAVDSIITIDRRGIIDSVNPATERMFGYERHELIGQNVSMLMPEPYASEHDGYLANYLKTGVKKIIGIGREVVARRKDGTDFSVYLAVSEVEQMGLFAGIIRDITKQKEAERVLLNYQRQLRSLTTELSLAEDRERRRIATGLHDQIAQTLAIAKIRLGGIMHSEQAPAEVVAELGRLRDTIDKAIQATRSLTFELVSPVLYELGLEAAIQNLAEEVEQQYGLACVFEEGDQIQPITEDTSVTLYRAVRELMMNTVKYARHDHPPAGHSGARAGQDPHRRRRRRIQRTQRRLRNLKRRRIWSVQHQRADAFLGRPPGGGIKTRPRHARDPDSTVGY